MISTENIPLAHDYDKYSTNLSEVLLYVLIGFLKFDQKSGFHLEQIQHNFVNPRVKMALWCST